MSDRRVEAEHQGHHPAGLGEADSYVELYHDVLIEKWAQLRRWIDEDRPLLELRDQVERRAVEWVESHEPTDRLLRGVELTEAKLLIERQLVLGKTTQRFMAASYKRHRQLERWRRFSIGTVVLLAFATAILVFGIIQNAAQVAYDEDVTEVRRLAHLAADRFDSELDFGLLTAVDAYDASLEKLREPDRVEALDVLAKGALANPRLQRYFHDHDYSVTAVAYHPSGDEFATADSDGRIVLWSEQTGEIEDVLVTEGPNTQSLEFSPGDGRYLAAGGCREELPIEDANHHKIRRTGLVRVWDLESDAGPVELLPPGGDVAVSVAFEPVSGALLAAATRDGSIHLWTTDDWSHRDAYPPVSPSYAPPLPVDPPILVALHDVAFHPGGGMLAGGYADGYARLWDIELDTVTVTPRAHGRPIAALAFSPDGSRLATASWDSQTLVWRIDAAGSLSFEAALVGHREPVRDVAFNSAGTLLATASNDKSVMIWDVTEDTSEQHEPLIGHSDYVTGVAFHPKRGTRLVTAGKDRVLISWDLKATSAIGQLHPKQQGRGVTSHAFHPDGSRLALGRRDGSIALVEDLVPGLDSDWPIATVLLPESPCTSGSCNVTSVAFIPDSSWVVAADREGSIRLWDTDSGEQLHASDSPSRVEDGPGIVVDGSGRRVFSFDDNGALTVFRLGGEDEDTLVEIDLPGALDGGAAVDGIDCPAIPSATFVGSSPPESGVVSQSDEVTIPSVGLGVSAAAISPDGDVIVTGNATGVLGIWSLDSGCLLGEEVLGEHIGWRGRGRVSGLAFNDDDGARQWYVTLRSGALVSMGQLTTDRTGFSEVQLLMAVDDDIRSLTVGRDGELAAVGTKRGDVFLYDLRSRLRLGAALEGHQIECLGMRPDGCRVSSISFSPTIDHLLVSTSPSGLFISWDVSPETMRRVSCERANAPVGDEAWAPCSRDT